MSDPVLNENVVSGVTFLLFIDAGGMQRVAGQRNARLSVTVANIDGTSKDSGDFAENLPSIRSFSVTADALIAESDISWQALEDSTLGDTRRRFMALLQTPAGRTYKAWFFVSSLDYEGAHDGAFTGSVSLTGTGKLLRSL